MKRIRFSFLSVVGCQRLGMLLSHDFEESRGYAPPIGGSHASEKKERRYIMVVIVAVVGTVENVEKAKMSDTVWIF